MHRIRQRLRTAVYVQSEQPRATAGSKDALWRALLLAVNLCAEDLPQACLLVLYWNVMNIDESTTTRKAAVAVNAVVSAASLLLTVVSIVSWCKASRRHGHGKDRGGASSSNGSGSAVFDAPPAMFDEGAAQQANQDSARGPAPLIRGTGHEPSLEVHNSQEFHSSFIENNKDSYLEVEGTVGGDASASAKRRSDSPDEAEDVIGFGGAELSPT